MGMFEAYSAVKAVLAALEDADVALNGGRLAEAVEHLTRAGEIASHVGYRISDALAYVQRKRNVQT